MIYTLRFDRAPLDLAAGILIGAGGGIYKAVPARAGVLHYPELGRRELYDPRNDAGLKTLEGAPVVMGHPESKKIDPMVRDLAPARIVNVRIDGDDVRAEIHVSAPWLSDEIGSGAVRELSVGYDVKLDGRPGTWRGERYDAMQVERIVDHVALLPPGAARCGPMCSIRSDQREERETMINNDGCYCSGETMCKPCAEIHERMTGGGAPRVDAEMERLVARHDVIGYPINGGPSALDVLTLMGRMEAGLEPDGAK